MCCGCRTPAINNFLNSNERLFRGMYFKSALYMAFYDYCESIYVFQMENGTCFIFELECGILEHMREERNSMEKYMMRIPNSSCAEYTTFD